MPGYDRFPQEIEIEGEEDEDEDEEEEEEEKQNDYFQMQCGNLNPEDFSVGKENLNEREEKTEEVETRWVLGSSRGVPGGVIESREENDQGKNGENFQQAFARNMIAAATRRSERVRKPKKFFDEMQTDNAAEASNLQQGGGTGSEKTRKRYASINVRTLAMKGDKHRKEACG